MGTGTPEEWTKTASSPNMDFMSTSPRGTSVATPLMKTVMNPEKIQLKVNSWLDLDFNDY